MPDTPLRAGVVVTLDPEHHTYRPGGVRLKDGQIIRVAPLTSFKDSTAQVNAHTHTPMVLFRGLAERHSLLTLEGW